MSAGEVELGFYEMDCGCRFKKLGDVVKKSDGLPPLELDLYNLPDCQMTWDLLKSGKTRGVFQLETSLGQNQSEKSQPGTIDELAAVTAVIRPACTKSFIDDKSLNDHYADRKTGRSKVESLHPSLDKILEESQQIILYQEEAIKIAQEVAGFSLIEGDSLRKSIGKKDSEEMKVLSVKFIEGCQANGLSKEDAEMIFEIIENSASYSFNKSHAVGYSYISYATAYVKAHFPNLFYTSWMHHAKEKEDEKEEIRSLVADAKLMGTNIYPPSLENIFKGDAGSFSPSKKGVYFGLSGIKGIGSSQIAKLVESIKIGESKIKKKVDKWTWTDFLFVLGPIINKTTMTNLILMGSAPGTISRKRAIFEYKLWGKLSDREKMWITEKFHEFTALEQAIRALSKAPRKEGGPANANRVRIVESIADDLANPKYDLTDDMEWVALNEQQLTGVSLSRHILDSYPISGDYKIIDFLEGCPDRGHLVCVIAEKKDYLITKEGPSKGKVMCFLTLEDQTGRVDAVCFNSVYEKFRDSIYDGAIVSINGRRSDRSKNGMIVNTLEVLN